MSAPTRLRHRVAEAVATHRLWEPGDRVAVAVSGGLDSVALLDLLCVTRGLHRGLLEVVTVDHGLRDGSAEDAGFVAELAASRGLPCHSRVVDLPEHASEAASRAARYAVFEALDVQVVALAHHRDDQAETVILRLLRGAGTAGLAGMGWRRDRYVRPLLGTRRDALVAYAAARGLEWREDPTNATPRYLRNRVRHEVLPLLEDLRPGAVEALARTARHASSDADLLDALARAHPHFQGPPWPRSFVADGAIPLVRRALLQGLPGAQSSHIDAIRDTARRGRGRVVLPGRVMVSIEDEQVVVISDPS